MTDPMIGRKIANFRIERLLGRGGMARVYYGLDTKLRRPVAIKVIDERYRQRPVEVKRFLKEAQLMAKWRHENIAQIYYCGDDGDLYYYVMEYIDGRDLASILASHEAKKKLMPMNDVLRIGAALADALDYAHSQGVIHRDVKPSNVLIASSGRVVLGDFGLALDIQDGSVGEAFGTPHYISPEQALHSANAVPQSDLYSLGVILYEMLTGSVPFADPSPTSAALQHIGQLPPTPRSLNPNLPRAVEKVLLRALEKSPQKRYQSGAALMKALKDSLEMSVTPADRPADLPPIPIGVPTIRKPAPLSIVPREASQPRNKPAPNLRHAASPPEGKSRPRGETRRRFPAWLVVIGVLACLSAVIVLWANGTIDPARMPWLRISSYLPAASPTPSPPQAAAEEETAQEHLPIPPAETAQTVGVELTVEAPPTASATSLPSPTIRVASAPASTLPAISAPESTPTIKYPTGNQFTLFYNENSIYLLNRSTATRSVSGFSFERLDGQGQPLDTFPGWMWSKYYETLPPDRCMILQVYDSFPYLNPPECKRFLSLLNPERDSGLIFWSTQEGSTQFRVLWRNEEVVRCEIGEGVCDFFTP